MAKEETIASLWMKLESLYLTKSIYNKLLLKRKLSGFRMKEGLCLKDHLDELNSILMDICNIDIKINGKDVAMILLVSLHPLYENFVSSLIVGKDSITLEEVRANLHKTELRHKAFRVKKKNLASELVVLENGKGQQKSKKKKGKSGPKDACYICKELGYWKKDCPMAKKKDSVTVMV